MEDCVTRVEKFKINSKPSKFNVNIEVLRTCYVRLDQSPKRTKHDLTLRNFKSKKLFLEEYTRMKRKGFGNRSNRSEKFLRRGRFGRKTPLSENRQRVLNANPVAKE